MLDKKKDIWYIIYVTIKYILLTSIQVQNGYNSVVEMWIMIKIIPVSHGSIPVARFTDNDTKIMLDIFC